MQPAQFERVTDLFIGHAVYFRLVNRRDVSLEIRRRNLLQSALRVPR